MVRVSNRGIVAFMSFPSAVQGWIPCSAKSSSDSRSLLEL